MNRAILVLSGAALLWLVMVAPLAAFDVNPDGTVTDPATGLMWDRCSWGQTDTDCSGGAASFHNWQAAIGIAVAANTANHLGYSDWRLPNRTELESLVDITRNSPATDVTAFPGTPSAFFWSSTVLTPVPATAWYVFFGSGGTAATSQTLPFLARLVRSGQSFDALAARPLRPIPVPTLGTWALLMLMLLMLAMALPRLIGRA